jgi:hypothetical protein
MIRNSANPDGSRLTFSRARWNSFVINLKSVDVLREDELAD